MNKGMYNKYIRNKKTIKNVKYVYLRPVVCLVYNNIDLNNIVSRSCRCAPMIDARTAQPKQKKNTTLQVKQRSKNTFARVSRKGRAIETARRFAT